MTPDASAGVRAEVPISISMDTGGTFTDGIFARGARLERVKVDTTPHDLTVCFRNCIAAGAARLGLGVPAMLAATAVVRFSTTVGTNSVIQRKGIRLGLLVSPGAGETLYAGDGQTANPLVDARLVRELIEDIDADGRVVRALDAAAVRVAVEALLEAGARFLVVSLRHSDRNPEHERRVKQVIAAQYPRHYLGAVPVLAASDLSIRAGDYARTNAAVLNAYLHPTVAAFLYKAEDYLRTQGYHRPLLIAHSTGGVARVAKTTAINTYNSGPVAGLLGARHVGAELLGLQDLITMDVGGTSLDIGVVRGGRVELESAPRVDGMALNIPLIEVETIGAGGCSIARVDPETGVLTVGPESTGAVPGPAAYALGGDQATVTDADLVLGYLDAENFLGGQRRLQTELAEQAIREHVAEPLGISLWEAAARVVQTIEQKMSEALRAIAGRQGYDPARFALFVYGGGGGLRCAGVARALGYPPAWLFEHSAAFSALGAATLDVMHLYEVSLALPLREPADWNRLAAEADGLVRRAARDMRGEGFAPNTVEYRFEATIEPATGAPATMAIPRAWVEGHGRLADLPVALCGPVTVRILRMRAVGATPRLHFATIPSTGTDPGAAQTATRPAWVDGAMIPVPVYSRERLAARNIVCGPAIVEASDTSYWVPAWGRLRVDIHRNCVLEMQPR